MLNFLTETETLNGRIKTGQNEAPVFLKRKQQLNKCQKRQQKHLL